MSKMTISGLKSFVASYVAANKQAGTWSASNTSFTGLLDKIGKQVTIDGDFNDKLPELDSDNLPSGKTIEEYFIDLTLPEAFSRGQASDDDAEDTIALPTVESVAYCYSLGRKKIKTTVPFDDVERACINPEEAGKITGKIMERLYNSESLYEFGIKKQLIGNMIDKAVTASAYAKVDVPVDTATGEAFIQKVKELAEDASFAHMGDCLAGNTCLIGATPSLVLYVKKGVIPNVEVQTLAGAFNKEDLALPVRIKVVDDFGTMTNQKNAWAVLVDERAVKLHNGYKAVRSRELADQDAINYVMHSEFTGFISKYCYVKAFTEIA